MEILDLRHFSSADLRPLLEDEIAMWGRQLSWDYATSAEMILRYMDAKILPGYAAIERGSIFGYSFFVYEQNKGVIGDLFVRESVRDGGRGPDRHEVEQRLLTHVIETLPQPPQFEIRPWSEQEYQSAAALITAAYRGHVDSEINDQYRTLTGSLRFLNNIVRFPGCGAFDPHASFVVLERRNQTLIGLILCSRVRPDVGHITQVCVLPEHRSAGLGEALLAAATKNLRDRGFHFISLTVTEANDRAIALYKRIGYESTRVFDAFVWEG